MKLITKIFSVFHKSQEESEPLRIKDIPDAPMTPDADDAELAAKVLLDFLSGVRSDADTKAKPEEGTPAYYHWLADRMRASREASRLKTVRLLAYCEQQMQHGHHPGGDPESLGLMESRLYGCMDTAEREGGELKRRWQHCLAEVTVRTMQAVGSVEDDNER